jgi:hypothetical protein
MAALAERYAGVEFTARSAAADLDPALWQAAGVARPDAGSCGRWLRAHKGPVHGFALTGKVDRNGANRWRLRAVEPRKPAPAIPRAPAPLPLSEAVPPEPLPALASRPWWSVAPAPPPASGGAAERPRGASWWADLGAGLP